MRVGKSARSGAMGDSRASWFTKCCNSLSTVSSVKLLLCPDLGCMLSNGCGDIVIIHCLDSKGMERFLLTHRNRLWCCRPICVRRLATRVRTHTKQRTATLVLNRVRRPDWCHAAIIVTSTRGKTQPMEEKGSNVATWVNKRGWVDKRKRFGIKRPRYVWYG